MSLHHSALAMLASLPTMRCPSVVVFWVASLALWLYGLHAAAISPPPVISGLIGLYTADSFRIADNVWIDLSGAGNNVTATGVVSVSMSSTGAPCFIWGTSSSSLLWPASVLPSEYTFFHVTRYLSGHKGSRSRIYQSAGSQNSISGFFGGRTGNAFRDGWLGGVEPDATALGTNYGWNFFLSADRRNSFRVNGQERNPSLTTYPAFGRLAVNPTGKGEQSDYAIRTIVIYNSRLTDSDVAAVEAWLYNRTCAEGSVFSLVEFGCMPCPRASLGTGSSTTCAGSIMPCPTGQKYSYAKSACRSTLPSVTNGLFGAYTAESYDVSNGFWYDLSSYGNNVTDTCGISLAQPANTPPFIYGGPASSIKWPVALPVSFSLFFVARYNGPSKGRCAPLICCPRAHLTALCWHSAPLAARACPHCVYFDFIPNSIHHNSPHLLPI
jgi:hypothetical protein